ncbi:cation/multidrug efflux system, membrane-fusion protein AcrA [Pseudogulbenkiania sp. NH8B]|uniref:efflux RND transporter periplasmic adaptor subunit n=1 Tax=Pseudogulbenkiania sp. (strain NH8B) TaxID=748280 RepID=UPI0002279EFA|nr:efflux RND transporter periplasmic adaptor subunit [Pseudogulbenkiania sp. NH8B]BAK77169.1 cation/multidrug efflux system, membrane-fusion protein AcrA [Pseudogulbenkiania sp. NH8B]
MRINKNSSLRLVTAATLAAVAVLTGCGEKQQTPPPGAGQPQEVGVVTVKQESLALSTELPGRLNPYRVSEVRARAAGIVLKQVFHEGSDVKQGELLFRIDPAPLQASLLSAEASLAKSEATLAQAKLQEGRYKELVAVNAVSKQDYDNAVAAVKQGLADVAAGKAAVQTAKLNLGYTSVTSPIPGRIGKAQVTEGALVGQNEPTLLATVQQLDPIYLDFTQSSSDMLRLRRAFDSGKLESVAPGQAKVRLVLDDGTEYPLTGKLLFSDVTVDQSTGMVTLRAEFPNPKHELLPGMYARARLAQAVDKAALTIPQQALQRGQGGSASVMLVGADNKVLAQPVKAETAVGDKWVVTEGLKAGDKVIVQGLQKIRPGAPVKPVAATSSAPASAVQGQ